MPDTDVPLARPEPMSLDSAAALLAAVLAGSGISDILGFGWGLPTDLSVAFIAIGLPMLFVQRRLAYRLAGDRLRVDVLTGTRELDLTEVTRARLVDGWLLVGPAIVPLPAYRGGLFHLAGEGLVRAYASRTRGPFVLLERGDARPWVLSPRDAEAFIETVNSRVHSASA